MGEGMRRGEKREPGGEEWGVREDSGRRKKGDEGEVEEKRG